MTISQLIVTIILSYYHFMYYFWQVIYIKTPLTMKDIAKEFNVSVASVSKALNNKEGLSNDLRERILKYAKENGYKSKITFKSIDTDTPIGIIIPRYFLTPAPAFYWTIYEELYNTLRQQKYYCLLDICNPNEDLSVPQFVAEGKVNGLIVLGYVPEEYLLNLEKYNLPLVMLDFYNDNVKGVSIMPDNNFSTYKITQYLIDQGHREIGFVGNYLATTNVMDRYLGYAKALLEAGIELNTDFVISDRDKDLIIFDEFLLPKQMPTAFVCCNDQAAYSFVKYLKKQGYKIPEDISITGFCNNFFSTICTPQLTTVDLNIKDLVDLAIRALFEIINYNSITSDSDRILLYGNIIMRDSVKKILD